MHASSGSGARLSYLSDHKDGSVTTKGRRPLTEVGAAGFCMVAPTSSGLASVQLGLAALLEVLDDFSDEELPILAARSATAAETPAPSSKDNLQGECSDAGAVSATRRGDRRRGTRGGRSRLPRRQEHLPASPSDQRQTLHLHDTSSKTTAAVDLHGRATFLLLSSADVSRPCWAPASGSLAESSQDAPSHASSTIATRHPRKRGSRGRGQGGATGLQSHS